MSEFKDKILQDILKNDRVANRVNELKLSKEQMYDALPILIDMADETDDNKTDTLTSFYVNERGVVKRMAILSSKGKKKAYLDNIITQDLNYVDFEEGADFIKEEGRKVVVNEFSKYIKGEQVKKGLYIHGDMGIGKTFMLKKFAKMLAENGKKVGFINVSNLVSKIKLTFNTTDSSETILNDLQEVDYLFVDDIGAEKISSWFRDEFLFPLLNERMDKKRITFFTSNYSTDGLTTQESKTSGAKYRDLDNAKRLVSRIKALSNEFKITGTNKRY